MRTRASSARPRARSTCRGRIPAGRSRTRPTGSPPPRKRSPSSRRKARRTVRVKGIGLSGQMHGATLLDRRPGAAPLHPVERHAQPCRGGQARRRPALSQADRQHRLSRFHRAKARLGEEQRAGDFRQGGKVLLPKDFLRLWLTGEHISEMSDSAGTSWLDVGQAALVIRTACRDGSRREADAVAGRRHGAGRRAAPRAGREMGDGRRASWSPAAPATMRRRPAAWARSPPARPSSRSARQACCLPPTPPICPIRKARCTHSATRCRTPGTRWASSCRRPIRSTGLSAITGKSAGELTAELGDKLKAPTGVSFLPYLSGERTPHNDAAIRGSFTGLGA